MYLVEVGELKTELNGTQFIGNWQGFQYAIGVSLICILPAKMIRVQRFIGR